jgi:glutamate synthase (NADPH/NADH) small chain
MLGHAVTVFDARPKAGGLNEYGLAAYKMLGERAAREVEFVLGIGGIELRTGQRLGRDVQLATLRKDFDAVFLGLGHTAVNRLGIDGEDAPGVLDAVRYIERIRQEALHTLPVGRRIVVIGGGNTAIDIAVQTRKLGAEIVTIVYRRGIADMGATQYEQTVAQTSGVLLREYAQPVAIHADPAGVTGVTFERTRADAQGRLSGTGEHFSLDCDMLFKAIGQRLDVAGLGLDGIELAHGRIAVDAERRTSLRDVFAGGDCVPGRDLTVVAVQDGKLAAAAIHRQLTEQAHG